MSIVNIKKELLKMLSYEKEQVYSSSDIAEKSSHNIKHNIFNDYYMLIYSNDSFSFVFDLKSKILEVVKKHENQYNELVKQYEQASDSEKKILIKEINILVDKIDAFNTVYNIINKNIKSKNNNYISNSNKIIRNLMELKTEKNADKRNELEEEIYSLKEERRVRLTSESDDLIIKEICELESLEYRIADARASSKPYTLDRKEYLNALKNTLHAINEYYFLDYKKSKYYKENPKLNRLEQEEAFARKFNLYVNRYYSLISSLFDDTYLMIGKESKISSDDLINYIAIYNLDGSYEMFRSKNKNRLIGTKEINKTDYLKKVEFLNNMINMLLNQCSNKIKNSTVTLEDIKSDRDELINLRNKKICEIDTMVNGEKVHARK